ncbi:MAG: TIGR03545 family protein [Bdellovibrio sp. CG10_big_fil_rev_8_21_14_0_10_47_8]|nr:MAG: TIGR03545 family protein [Bdellovibrio sp. CG10_big_fil_rev_8_21_14_0_10_47_8]
MNQQNIPAPKKKKEKGPIRTEAVVPFLIVVLVTFLYFHFLFDTHLRKAIEFAGYQIMGAEVDVARLETSFFKGTIRIQGVEVTNSEKPSFNVVSIGDIRFGVLWDGLLRARLIVQEMAVEQIEIGQPRKTPGRVKPPEPPKKPGESALEKEANKLKDKALDKVEKNYDQNVLGDVAAMLGGTSSQDQFDKIQANLPSQALLKSLETEFQGKQKLWEEKLKSLPQAQEIQAIGDRLGKVKVRDFKTPQEVQQSLQQIDAILKDADSKVKLIQATGGELDSDIKKFDAGMKELDAMVKKDIQDLESRFRLPKLDAKSLSRSLFYPYLAPYLNKFNKYKGIVEKYAPPKLLKKKGSEEADTQVQPHPREKGIAYEFGRPNSYPLFWVKKISVSSQAGSTPGAGNMKGLVTDVTSNQTLVGKPTVLTLEGDFPSDEVHGFKTQATIDNRTPPLRASYKFSVDSYPIQGRDLIQSNDANISFKKATGSMNSTGQLIGLSNFSFELNNQIRNIDYQIQAPNPTVDEILKAVFTGVPVVTVDASGQGDLPNLSMSINSNLGPELQRGFEKQIQKKIDEARAKLQAFINEKIGKEKAKFEGEVNKTKSQVEGQVKKAQDQINSEKSKGEAKSNQAKKDAENNAKKGVEDQVKKALGPDGDKKLDDLKKRFGL